MSFSKDPFTKVGAIATINKRVVGTGRNGFPPNFPDEVVDKIRREEKNLLSSHAEANLISFAANAGVSLKGADLFVTYPVCNDCAKLIITAGIKKVFTTSIEDVNIQWYWRWELSKAMFQNVDIEFYENFERVYSKYSIIEAATKLNNFLVNVK